MIEVTTCPICQSSQLEKKFPVKDHSISKEEFEIKQCSNCSLLITTPRPEELSHYYQSDDYVSHSSKSTNLINKIYLVARTYTIKCKLNLVNSLQPKGSALDIGCGTGAFLSTLKKNGWKVTGVEPNNEARQKATHETNQTIHSSYESIKDQFTLITLWHVLEHLPNLDLALKKIYDLLEPSGVLLIAVPNHNSFDAKKYKDHWAGYDVPRHLWHFNQKSMVSLLQKHELKLDRIIPMKLDAFYVSMLSESYLNNGHSLLNSLKGFFTGLFSNYIAMKTGQYSSLIYIAKK